MEKQRIKEYEKDKKMLLKKWKEEKKWYMNELKKIENCQKNATSDLEYLNTTDIQEKIKLLNSNGKVISKLLEGIKDWNNAMHEELDIFVSQYFKAEHPGEHIAKEIEKISVEINTFSLYVKKWLTAKKSIMMFVLHCFKSIVSMEN